MLCLDTIRGEDSTGIMSVYKDKSFNFAKGVGTPWDLMKSGNMSKVFSGYAGAFIGHNRAATKGKVEEKNAHPFIFEKFMGVHNGTLNSQYNLDDYKDFEVDSENIYHHMNNNGIDETLNKLIGAFSLAFYDKEEHKVHLVRNDKRPMTYAFSDDAKTVFFASEGWMISIACARFGIKIREIKETEIGKLYSFPVPDCNPSEFKGYEHNYTVEDVEFHKYKPVEYSYDYSNNNRNITPFYSRQNTNKQTYERQKGSTVMFEVIGPKREHSAAYLEVSTTMGELAGRVYMSKDNPLMPRMIESVHYFRGKVIGVGSDKHGKPFLTFNAGSIEEVIPAHSSLTVKKYKLFDGTLVDMRTWLDKVKCACSRCNRLPLVSDHEEIIWLDDEQFLCRKCADSVTYIDNYSGD